MKKERKCKNMKNIGATKRYVKEVHKAPHSKPKKIRAKVKTKQKTKKIGFIKLLLYLFLGLEIDNE